jgi:carbon-monoxide dehydrogenase large subunit
MPGVCVAVSGSDAPELTSQTIPVRLHPPPNAEAAAQPPLAKEIVRYVGEPVAVVVAENPRAAEDAAAAVRVEVEPLEPLIDCVAASGEGATRLHQTMSDNVVGRCRLRWGEPVDQLFAGADVLVTERLTMHRHSAAPMETRGLVAEVDSVGRLTVWGPTKVKHANRVMLAGLLGLSVDDIRFVETDVGGSFGPRGEFYPEDLVIPWLAMRLQRPVKWVEDRVENLVAMNHSREHVYDVELAALHDGTLLGFKVRDWCDMGAYLRTTGMVVPEISSRHLSGPYRWAGFAVETLAVLTNKTPIGTYRGPGESEATFARERMMDLLAHELAVDPAELRLRNLITTADMPLRLELGPEYEPVIHESGDYREQFRALLDHIGYTPQSTNSGPGRRNGQGRGMGFSCFINEGAYGPFEWARIVAERDLTFTAYVGAAAFGQGARTSLAQILADALGVPFERVRISHHDTDLVLEGVGSWADRTSAMAGSAVLLAAQELHREACRAGAQALGVDEDALEVSKGVVRIHDDDRAITFAELGCTGTARFERAGMAFTFGAAVAEVTIDPTTAGVTVDRYAGAYDAGRTINPALALGQLNGAAAQGIAGALFEELAYGPDGQPLATSLMDYMIPTSAEIPEIESLILEFPAPDNPLGIKGIGNPGIVGTYAALANAVADAIGEDVVRVTSLPLRPSEVKTLLESRTLHLSSSLAGSP